MVTDSSSLTSEESLRQTQFQNWGYTVTTIIDSDSQANFNTAFAAADVVYVSEEVNATSLAYKLREATIGVINEERFLDIEFGFSTSDGYESNVTNQIVVTDNSHPVSTGLATGFITIFSSTQPRSLTQGTIASGFQTLATGSSGDLCLGVIEAGGALANTYNSNSTASGRRVRLPWGGGSFSFSSLDSDGLSILQNALAWASGNNSSRLVGHWKLDETSGTFAADSSGLGNHGTMAGATLPGDYSPYPGETGLELDDPAIVRVPYDDTLNMSESDAFSIACWIELNNETVTESFDIAGKTDEAGRSAYLIRLETDQRIGIYLNEDDLTGGGGEWEGYSTATLDLNRTYHICVTYDAARGSLEIYIDGVLDSTHSVSIEIGDEGNGFVIGDLNASAALIHGVDNVVLYNRVMQPQEIAEHYGLVGHWVLDESSGTTANDSSLNDNDGSHQSGVTVGQSGPLTGTLAAEYDGSNNQTEILHGGNWNAVDDSFSLATWVRIDTVSDLHGLIVWSDTASPFALLVNSDDELDLRVNWGSVAGESGNISHASAGTLSQGTWTHVAVTYDGSTVRFYFDGVEDSNPLSSSVTIGTSNDEMQIGGDDGSDYDLTGAMYDARVYNRAISPEEIADLAATGVTTTTLRITSWVEVPNP